MNLENHDRTAVDLVSSRREPDRSIAYLTSSFLSAASGQPFYPDTERLPLHLEPRGSEPGDRHPVLVTVDRSDLEELVGMVPRGLMDIVDQGLRWFLRLGGSIG